MDVVKPVPTISQFTFRIPLTTASPPPNVSVPPGGMVCVDIVGPKLVSG